MFYLLSIYIVIKQDNNMNYKYFYSFLSTLKLYFFQSALMNNKQGQDKQIITQCSICANQLPEAKFVQINQCQHLFCLQCSLAYLTDCILSFRKITCPYACQAQFKENNHILSYLSENLKNSYKKYQLKRYCIQNNLKLCPNQKCINGILYENEKLRKKNLLKCRSCKLKYCKLCEWPEHIEKCLESVQKFIEKELLYAKCPKCTQIIEKSEGCIHMTCLCKFQFCYKCLNIWQDDHLCEAKNKRKIKLQILDEKGPNFKTQQKQFQSWLEEQAQNRYNLLLQAQNRKRQQQQERKKLKMKEQRAQLMLRKRFEQRNIIKIIENRIQSIKTRNMNSLRNLQQFQIKFNIRVRNADGY